jgi:hypothetical protein
MKQVTITREQYVEEINDEVEIRDCRTLGPLYRLPSGESVRIPHSGFEAEGIVFRLSGFGKKDRAVIAALPTEPETWLKKFLDKAYTFYFNDELRGALVSRLKSQSWSVIKKEIQTAQGMEMGKLQAVRFVLLGEEPKGLGTQPPVVKPAEVETLSDDRLKEMGLL